MTTFDDCIAAVASAAGGGARGIVRISGLQVAEVIRKCFEADGEFEPTAVRRAQVFAGRVRLSATAIELPCRLYFWPSARSYTGQPSAELHAVGSPPLLEQLLDVVRRAGARLAQPGEFTLRAFLAGRIDLTQAEAVLGVIDARNGSELASALEQLAGGLGAPLRRLRGDLLDLLADLEAGLDFVNEDIPFISRDSLVKRLMLGRESVGLAATQMHERDATSAPLRVVLIGAPNAGKSSLFNALAGGGRAIVADVPGTTRDYLVAQIEFGGAECELVDTAGMEETELDVVASESQSFRSKAQERAEIEIWCRDAAKPWAIESPAPAAQGAIRIPVWTKIDSAVIRPPVGALATSIVTGAGLAELRDALRIAVLDWTQQHGGGVRATAARCRATLDEALTALARAQTLAEASLGEELVAAEVRSALHAVGEVVGAVYTDDLLDRVFSRFCIGK